MFETLAMRFLRRSLKAEDACSPAAVTEAQAKLGVALPASLRQYYLSLGLNTRFNESHNVFRPVSALAVEDGHLVFMDENQDVVSWGFRLEDLDADNPLVWQRNNTPPTVWYAEDLTLYQLLESMFLWYESVGIWPQPEAT